MFMKIIQTPPAADTSAMPARHVRTGKCACCGKRRDLVAHTGMSAAEADHCFRCGSDRAQGLDYCSSAPQAYTHTFSATDWDAPA